jgi:hypothetical protein
LHPGAGASLRRVGGVGVPRKGAATSATINARRPELFLASKPSYIGALLGADNARLAQFWDR